MCKCGLNQCAQGQSLCLDCLNEAALIRRNNRLCADLAKLEIGPKLDSAIDDLAYCDWQAFAEIRASLRALLRLNSNCGMLQAANNAMATLTEAIDVVIDAYED